MLLNAKRDELRSYIALALTSISHLYGAGRDDEVAVAVVHLALDLQRLQHPILVRPRADLEPRDGQRGGLAGPPRRLG